jgi:site-specific recombinase XerD
VTLLQLQETYLDYLRKQRRSLTTVSLNRRWLGGFQQFCAVQGVELLADLTPELLPAYHQHLQGRLHNRKGRRYAPNSLYQMVYTLRNFLRWAFLQGYLKIDLGEGVALARPTPSVCLEPSDLELLYRQADSDAVLSLRDAALVALCYEAELTLEQVHCLDLERAPCGEASPLPRGGPKSARATGRRECGLS